MNKLRWGILGTANIAQQWVIPAIQDSGTGDVSAIASRNAAKAKDCAQQFGIPHAFANYQDLLDCAEVDAIYNPLPNHLHIPFTIRALEAGKHVLCEKPIGLDSDEVRQLMQACQKYPHLRVMEAFMYRFHPQWNEVFSQIKDGRIGTLRSVHAHFSFFNNDPANVRNQPGIGGGALMDVGCYCVSVARALFNREPSRVVAQMDVDREFGVDRTTSAVMDFGTGTATFYCSMQSAPSQGVKLIGERGIINMNSPFYRQASPTEVETTSGEHHTRMAFESSNHYVEQIRAFNRSVLDNHPIPVPLEDALANMKAIDALVASWQSQGWVSIA